MREDCECPYCGGHHPHICRVEGPVMLCWCQWCYRVHEVSLVGVEPPPLVRCAAGHDHAALELSE